MPVKRTGSLKNKLSRLDKQMIDALRPVVYAVAGGVQTDAQISITAGAVSGKHHVPSAPGTPPNNDSGHLANSIQVEEVDALTARVVVHAEYGAIQELGGTAGNVTLPERPYMRPAAAKNKDSGRKLMRAAVDRVLKDGKL